MKLLPLLNKPRFLAAKNRWRRGDSAGRVWARDLLLGLLTIGVLAGVYKGGFWLLAQTESGLDAAYISPRLILGLFLFFISIVLLIGNTLAALGALYLGKDLENIVSSPISPWGFYFGKFTGILLSSSWMSALLLLPVILLFGQYYNQSFPFYLLAAFALIPFFLIPTAISMTLSSLLAALLPRLRAKELTALAIAATLGAFYYLLQQIVREVGSQEQVDVNDILQFVSLLAAADVTWSPSYWVSMVLGESIAGSWTNSGNSLVLLYSASLFFISLGYLVVTSLHFSTYSALSSRRSVKLINSQRSQRRLNKILSWLPAPTRAFVIKELKCFFRDVNQSMQFLLFAALAFLYLYALNLQGIFEQLIPDGQQRWWRGFLALVNVIIEAFVITSIGSRLVFPSLSREGRAVWILDSGPLNYREVLRIKFWSWLIPILVTTGLVFGLAAYLISGRVDLAFLKIVSNSIVCFGIVGLAIGIGAYFADFHFENPSQLVTGIGGLVFMICSVLFICLHIFLLVCFGIFLMFHGNQLAHAGLPYWLMILGAAVVLALLSLLVSSLSIKTGVTALQRRKESLVMG